LLGLFQTASTDPASPSAATPISPKADRAFSVRRRLDLAGAAQGAHRLIPPAPKPSNRGHRTVQSNRAIEPGHHKRPILDATSVALCGFVDMTLPMD
jgi:hypothetical protein